MPNEVPTVLQTSQSRTQSEPTKRSSAAAALIFLVFPVPVGVLF
jgi:hypothetical protein